MLTAVFVFLAFFVIVAALLWSIFQLFSEKEDPLGDRLDELQANQMVTTQRSPRRRAGGGFFNSVLYLVSLVPGGEDFIRGTERELGQAGVRNKSAVVYYILFQVTFFVLLMGGMLYFQWDNPFSNKIGGLAAAFILGYLLPQQVLHRLVKRYRTQLTDALPDTIDLLGIVLGTGLGLDQAMLRVSEEMQYIYPALANEFYTVVMQVKAGQERSKAFQQLIRRTGIEDIKSLAAMIIQSERFGTSLSQALKVYADALRTRRRLKAEATVAKAGIKMLFPIVLFILPALFVITLVPGMISVLRDLRGGIGAK
ncbi:MAG: type II secretion system F family protein [Candidatus Solibacter usitatus]|nr:type II secretion system F family protein [Candidatus Solibacter usitatus]